MITIGLKDPTGKPLGYPRIEEEKEMEIPPTIAAVTDEDITRFAEIRFNSLFNPIDEQSKSWLFT